MTSPGKTCINRSSPLFVLRKLLNSIVKPNQGNDILPFPKPVIIADNTRGATQHKNEHTISQAVLQISRKYLEIAS